MENQTKMIKAHLDEGNSITAFEALKLYGCFRLASRMHDLKESGYPFMKEMIKLDNGKSVACYTKVNL
jgi:hypothetical protein